MLQQELTIFKNSNWLRDKFKLEKKICLLSNKIAQTYSEGVTKQRKNHPGNMTT